MYDHLIIDGKNSIYRAIFTKHSAKIKWSPDEDIFIILLRFINSYIKKFNPSSVSIVWDAPNKQVWRHRHMSESNLSDIILPYKGHRGTLFESRDFNPEEELQRLLIICTSMFRHMNIRQYFRHGMEADDLIYAFCKIYSRSKIVIVSSDGDLLQIPFMFENVHVHNPLSKHAKSLKKVEPRPSYDIAAAKSLMGDKSDNILGYYQIGKVKSKRMAQNVKERAEFLASDKAVTLTGDSDNEKQQVHVGRELFNINRQVIDLSFCPHLMENSSYIEDRSTSDINFSLKTVGDLISKYEITGFHRELENYFSLFEDLK